MGVGKLSEIFATEMEIIQSISPRSEIIITISVPRRVKIRLHIRRQQLRTTATITQLTNSTSDVTEPTAVQCQLVQVGHQQIYMNKRQQTIFPTS